MSAQSPTKVDILIAGSGPAGYTAAIYGARAGYKVLLATGLQPGGQLMLTDDIENFPGFPDPIGGAFLMDQMREQTEKVGAEILDDLISEVDLNRNKDGLLHFKADGGKEFLSHTVVIATGAQARWLGLESETRLQGKGVSACATCDGFFYKKKPVAVIGGGNTAVEEALYLSKITSEVFLIHRRDTLTAERIIQKRLEDAPNITFIPDHQVEEILGDDFVTGLKIAGTKDPSSKRTLKVDGVFIAIGHAPNLGPFKGQVEVDSHGYVVTKKGTSMTAKPGVFAAGDIQDPIYKQAVTAAGSGCMAALDAQRYLESLSSSSPKE